jgi:hypothetical protein
MRPAWPRSGWPRRRCGCMRSGSGSWALPGVSPAVRRWVLLRILRTPAVFLLSIPVALVQPNLAKWLWLLIFAGGFVLRRFEPADDEPVGAKRRT